MEKWWISIGFRWMWMGRLWRSGLKRVRKNRLDGAMDCLEILRQLEFAGAAQAEFGGDGEDHLAQPERGLRRVDQRAELCEECIVADGRFGEPDGLLGGFHRVG